MLSAHPSGFTSSATETNVFPTNVEGSSTAPNNVSTQLFNHNFTEN
jgi:hypothetical protein